MPGNLGKPMENQQNPLSSKPRPRGAPHRPVPGSAAEPMEPIEKRCKNNRFSRDPLCPRGPAGGAAGEAPGPATTSSKTLINHKKINENCSAANGGRVGDGAGEILGPGTSSSETLEKHWKMNGNCYTANGGVLVLVNGGVPDTLYNLRLNKRWTLPLCD